MDALGHTAVGLTELFMSIYQDPKYRRYMGYGVGGGVALAGASYGLIKYWQFKQGLEKTESASANPNRPKARLDNKFIQRLKLLLSIVVPSYKYVRTIILTTIDRKSFYN